MSLFGTILEKIGITKPAASTTAASDKAKIDSTVSDAMAKAAAEAKARVAAQTNVSPDAKSPAVLASATPSAPSTVSSPNIAPSAPPLPPASAAPARPAAVPMVDVMSKLEGLSRSHPGLNWKVSIVDLLKLLDMDSSFDARKALAVELGCPPNLMDDSASMNTWLHKTVLEKIAENGGNIPATMLEK